MGIFLGMWISKAVTRPEWERVYEETLELVKNFPFAELREVKVRDIDIMCLARYYPMVRIEPTNDYIRVVIQGFVLNDDLYSDCRKLAESN